MRTITDWISAGWGFSFGLLLGLLLAAVLLALNPLRAATPEQASMYTVISSVLVWVSAAVLILAVVATAVADNRRRKHR